MQKTISSPVVLGLYHLCKSHRGPKPEVWLDPGIGKLKLHFLGGSLFSSELRYLWINFLTCCSIALRGVLLYPKNSNTTAYIRKELYVVPLSSTLSTVFIHISEELQ